MVEKKLTEGQGEWTKREDSGLIVPNEAQRKIVTPDEMREMLGINVPDFLDSVPPPEVIAKREQEFFASLNEYRQRYLYV